MDILLLVGGLLLILIGANGLTDGAAFLLSLSDLPLSHSVHPPRSSQSASLPP